MKKVCLLFLVACVNGSCSTKTPSDTLVETADSISVVDSTLASHDEARVETEVEEFERRAKEEAAIYNEMSVYDGEYVLSTESEGADGRLRLRYLGNKIFTFSLKVAVPDICEGIVEDTAYVDRTQHAFYRSPQCLINFELQGQTIEITAEEGCSKMKGACSFSGVYQYSTELK
jgi:hypothetical protein